MEANRKRAQVHMLPTEDTNPVNVPFLLSPHGNTHRHLAGGEFRRLVKSGYIPQHLYFTTDEEIKEGDWYLLGNTPRQSTGDLGKPDTKWLKIIASTDPKLLTELGRYKKMDARESFTFKKGRELPSDYKLPQPSQAFIKAYCEQGGIDEVDVEYEYHKVWDRQTEELLEKYLLLKVDSHNTITTHRIIEKKYSIDDIEAYCDKYPNDTELGREIRKLRYKQ